MFECQSNNKRRSCLFCNMSRVPLSNLRDLTSRGVMGERRVTEYWEVRSPTREVGMCGLFRRNFRIIAWSENENDLFVDGPKSVLVIGAGWSYWGRKKRAAPRQLIFQARREPTSSVLSPLSPEALPRRGSGRPSPPSAERSHQVVVSPPGSRVVAGRASSPAR